MILILLIFTVSYSYGQNQPRPERVISLAPSLTKNLYLLDAGDILVGCTNYCSLQATTDAKIVANAVQVNYEQIVLLEPDLIITTNLTKTRTLHTFKKMGIAVKVFENPVDYGMIREQFLELGRLLGKHEKAKTVIDNTDEKLELIMQKIPHNIDFGSPRVFMQLGANPLFTVVPGSFMHDYMNLSSTENVASDLKVGSINLESVLMRNPDVIFIVLMGMIGEEEKEKWMRFSQLNAVKEKKIFTLDADKACSPTPVSFIETLEEVVDKLYFNKSLN